MADMKGLEFEIVGSSVSAVRSIENLKKSLSSMGTTSRKAAKHLSSFAKQIATAPIKKATESIKDFANKLTSVGSAFRRILFYRAIRSVIREIGDAFKYGVNNLYAWSNAFGGEFANSMDRISTSFAYFKNSVGAAVAPLINALAPAIDYVIDKAVTILNVINQLFARLSGATYWTRATKQATAYGDAAGSAGSAAKEAMRYLAPFDELNVLPDDSSGGGGGGGGGSGASGLFEEMVQFDQEITDFAQMIKDAWANNDWEGVGTFIGDKLNDLIENRIPWASLGEKFGKGINAIIGTEYWTLETVDFVNLGNKIAEFVNNAIENVDFDIAGRLPVRKLTAIVDTIIGFIYGLDADAIGQAVADFVGGAISEAQTWLTETPFRDLGNKVGELLTSVFSNINDVLENTSLGTLGSAIARFINGALEGTDWKEIGALPVNIFTGLIDNIISFLKTLDWGLVTSSFSDLLIGAFSSATRWLDSVNWSELGSALWQKIKDAFAGIDYEGLANSFFTLLGTALKSGIQFIGGFLVGIGQDIADWWAEDIKGANFSETVSNLWDAFKTALGNINNWVRDNIVDPFMNALVGADWTGIDQAAANLWESFKSWLSTAIIIPDDFGEKILAGLNKPFEELQSWASETLPNTGFGKWINDWFIPDENGMSGIKTSIDEWFTNIKNWFINGWNGIIDSIAENSLAQKLSDWLHFDWDDLKLDPIEINVAADYSQVTSGYYKAKNEIESNPIKLITAKTELQSSIEAITNGYQSIMQIEPPTWANDLKINARANLIGVDQDKLTKDDRTVRNGTLGVSSVDSTKMASSERTIKDMRGQLVSADDNIPASQKTASGFKGIFSTWDKSSSWDPWSYIKGWFTGNANFSNSWSPWSYLSGWFTGNANFSSNWAPWSYVAAYFYGVSKYMAWKSWAPWSYIKGYFNAWQWYKGFSPWSYMKAWYNSYSFASGWSPWSYITGWFRYWYFASGWKPWSYVTGYIRSNAGGGVYSNGKWQPIAAFASGGIANSGQLFVARESGPELVGTLKGHTAVMNNDQIVASVSAGVAKAISSVEFHMNGFATAAPMYTGEDEAIDYDRLVRAIVDAIDQADVGGDTYLDGEVLYRNVAKYNKQNTRRTGANLLAGMA